MTQPIFVASPVDVWEGDKALPKLERTNDTRFETADGVLQVDSARWLQAQTYERETWLTYNTGAVIDRNDFHREQLGNYEALPDALGKVIELGCGVFTNLRFMLETHGASEPVYLVDPLVKDYQEHPHCTYKDGKLHDYTVELIDKPIEDWNTKLKFDTLVMINTLPHCYDALKVLDFVRKHVRSGGYVVIGESPREHPAATHYDVGHPIALKAHVLEAFLGEFEEVYRNGWYFIGRVK